MAQETVYLPISDQTSPAVPAFVEAVNGYIQQGWKVEGLTFDDGQLNMVLKKSF